MTSITINVTIDRDGMAEARGLLEEIEAVCRRLERLKSDPPELVQFVEVPSHVALTINATTN